LAVGVVTTVVLAAVVLVFPATADVVDDQTDVVGAEGTTVAVGETMGLAESLGSLGLDEIAAGEGEGDGEAKGDGEAEMVMSVILK